MARFQFDKYFRQFQAIVHSTTRVLPLDRRTKMCLAVDYMSHPTVGVALFGTNISDRLGSLSNETAVRMQLFFRIFVFRTAVNSAYCTSAGRVAQTNFFPVLYRVRY